MEKIVAQIEDIDRQIHDIEHGEAPYNAQCQSLQSGVEKLFGITETETDDYVALIGSNGVTEQNMLHYLGAFELMVDNLLQNDQVQDQLNFEQDGGGSGAGSQSSSSFVPDYQGPKGKVTNLKG